MSCITSDGLFLGPVLARCQPWPGDSESAICPSCISQSPLKRIVPFATIPLLGDTDRTRKPKLTAVFSFNLLLVKIMRCFLGTLQRYPIKVFSFGYHYEPIDLNIVVTVLLMLELSVVPSWVNDNLSRIALQCFGRHSSRI